MKVQRWTVYRKDEDGQKTDIGTVVTSLDASNEVAWNKAAHKYLLGKTYTIGWSMHVKKSEVEDLEAPHA